MCVLHKIICVHQAYVHLAQEYLCAPSVRASRTRVFVCTKRTCISHKSICVHQAYVRRAPEVFVCTKSMCCMKRVCVHQESVCAPGVCVFVVICCSVFDDFLHGRVEELAQQP